MQTRLAQPVTLEALRILECEQSQLEGARQLRFTHNGADPLGHSAWGHLKTRCDLLVGEGMREHLEQLAIAPAEAYR